MDMSWYPNVSDPGADLLLAVMYGVIFIIGIPGNIVSFKYYLSESVTLSTVVYRFISFTDILIHVFGIPEVFSVATRKPVMFSWGVFCTLQRMIFVTLSSLSVFWVGILSISRTYVMLFPFNKISTKKIVIFKVMYIVFWIARYTLEFSFGYSFYTFNKRQCHCNNYNNANVTKQVFGIPLGHVNISINFVTWVFPILPISISCAISIYLLRRVNNLGANQDQSTKTKIKATNTIIIVTIIYIICNLPSAILQVLFLLCISYNTYPEPFFANTFMGMYMWNIAVVFTVCLNSTLNPVVYYFRNSKFRRNNLVSVASRSFRERRSTKKNLQRATKNEKKYQGELADNCQREMKHQEEPAESFRERSTKKAPQRAARDEKNKGSGTKVAVLLETGNKKLVFSDNEVVINRNTGEVLATLEQQG